MRKIKKRVIIKIIFSILLMAYGLYMIAVPWYLGNDDKYAVDNLQFVADKAKEAGIDFKINTKGINRLKYPTPVALLELVDVTSNWTNAYMAANELVRIKEKSADYKNHDSKTNPYNTLSLINYGAEIEIVSLPYELIKYHTAITDPNAELSADILKQYVQITNNLEERIISEYKPYYEYYKAREAVGFFCIVLSALVFVLVR